LKTAQDDQRHSLGRLIGPHSFGVNTSARAITSISCSRVQGQAAQIAFLLRMAISFTLSDYEPFTAHW
jgi:hypothetical protein